MIYLKCNDALRCSYSVFHYGDVIMGAIASQITSLTVVYSTVYSDADQRKHQSSASLAFVWGIHRGPVNSSHKWPVTRKMLPFDDVIKYFMSRKHRRTQLSTGVRTLAADQESPHWWFFPAHTSDSMRNAFHPHLVSSHSPSFFCQCRDRKMPVSYATVCNDQCFKICLKAFEINLDFVMRWKNYPWNRLVNQCDSTIISTSVYAW